MASARRLFWPLPAQPELLAEQAWAYGEMLSADWLRRTRLRMLAAGALLASVVLAGQAVLRWAGLRRQLSADLDLVHSTDAAP